MSNTITLRNTHLRLHFTLLHENFQKHVLTVEKGNNFNQNELMNH